VANVGYATPCLFVMFTAARRVRKTATVQFNESANWPNGQGIRTVPTLQDGMGRRPTNRGVVAPIKAGACDALLAVLKSTRRQTAADPRIMPRGVERC